MIAAVARRHALRALARRQPLGALSAARIAAPSSSRDFSARASSRFAAPPSRRRSTAQQLPPPPAATGASADATPTPTRTNANADARKITAQLGRCRDIPELLHEFHKYRHELNPIHLSTFWMSVVRCAPPAHVLHGEELRPAREALLEQLPLFHGWAIANTAYALGKLGVGNAPAFEEAWEVLERIALAHITLARSGEVTEQGLSNLAWAFAKAERPVPQLFDAIAAEAARPQRRAKFVPQNLSNIVWAFAKANHDAPQLFDTLAWHAASDENFTVGDWYPQAAANIAWAYSKVGHVQPALFAAIEERALAILREVPPPPPPPRSGRRRRAATADDAAKAPRMKPQELSNIAWAFAMQVDVHAAPRLFEAIETEVLRQLADDGGAVEWQPQNLANLAWAFGVVDCAGDALVADGSPFIAKLSTAFDADAQPEVLSQLHLFTLWRTERLARRGGDAAAAGAALPPSLAEACRAAFHRHQTSPSGLQAQVKATLEDLLQLPLEEEVLTEEGYSLDLVATIGSTKVAFEVDGPIHFLGARQGGAGRRPTGSTVVKRRLLKSLGYIVIPVPYFEWEACNVRDDRAKERKSRAEYMTSKLCQLEAEIRAREAAEAAAGEVSDR